MQLRWCVDAITMMWGCNSKYFMRFQSYSDPIVICWCNYDDMLMQLWWCVDAITMMCWCNYDDMLMQLQWCVDAIAMMCWCNSKYFMRFQSYSDPMQILMSFPLIKVEWYHWFPSKTTGKKIDKIIIKRCCDTTTQEPIHTKDESKRGSAFAFIFGVNWPVQWM